MPRLKKGEGGRVKGEKHYSRRDPSERELMREDCAAMIAEADAARSKSARNKFLIALLYLTGARPIECTRLLRSNFVSSPDKSRVVITIPIAKQGQVTKFHAKAQSLSIPKTVMFAEYIIDYVNSLTVPTDRVLPISAKRIQQIVYWLSRGQFCPYHFRHGRLTKLSRNKATIDELLNWKRSNDIRSIAPYLKFKEVEGKEEWFD